MNRRTTIAATALGALTMLASAVVKPSVRVAFNASDSAPGGFYKVQSATQLQIGDYVIARLPEAVAAFADARHYLPRSVPVLKQIAAMNGQRVCVRHATVLINNVVVAKVLDTDGDGRPLTVWEGCRELLDGELFLLNTSNPASFDSRYFGPIDVSFVRGRAIQF